MDHEVLHLPTFSERLSLHFEDVCYSVPDRKAGVKQILCNVSGEFNSGRLTAILGASGAGKTSLLNVLSGFKTKGVSGSVKVNGVERDADEFRTKSCYIAQNQSMMPLLTSKETLTLAANLKLKPGWEKDSATRSVVSNIFGLLGLLNTEHTSVQSLSGGEKKRLCIGLELITNPPIMFFDEPTSGLDSSAAAQVISHLQALSAIGHAIVCVIHQPSSRTFSMFDDLYLMSAGQCLYAGPTVDMIPVFEEAGFKYPDYYNRADFAMEIASHERGDDLSVLLRRFEAKTTYPLTEVITDGQGLPLLLSPTVPISIDTTIRDDFQSLDKKMIYRRYPTTHFQQFVVLLRRSFKCTIRDMMTTQIMIASNVLIALLFGMVYFGIGNDAGKVDSNLACLFIWLLFAYMCNSVTTVVIFPSEMAVFLQEHLNNWYSLPAYYFAKTLSHIPVQFVCIGCFMTICYFMTDQPMEASRFFMTFLPAFLLCVLSQAVGLIIGAMFNVQLGVFMVPAFSIPMYVFSGFLIRLQDITVYFKWISTISYVRHCFEAMVTAIYGLDRPRLSCTREYCHYKNPQKLLDDLGMSGTNYWPNIIGLVVWILVVYSLLYAVLKWRVYKSK